MVPGRGALVAFLPMKDQTLKDFYKKGVPRRGQEMPVRRVPLVPKFLDEGRDAGIMGIENSTLKQCACTKGLLMLCDATGTRNTQLRHFPQTKAIQKAWAELQANAKDRREGKNKDDIERIVGKAISELKSRRSSEPNLRGHWLAPETGTTPEGVSVTGDVLHPSDEVSVIREATRQVLDVKRNEAARISSRSSKTPRTELREVLSNPARGHSNFFKALKADQFRPSTVVMIKGQPTSNVSCIMENFVEQWHTVFHRLAEEPPQFEDFEVEYGEFMNEVPTGDLLPNAAQ